MEAGRAFRAASRPFASALFVFAALTLGAPPARALSFGEVGYELEIRFLGPLFHETYLGFDPPSHTQFETRQDSDGASAADFAGLAHGGPGRVGARVHVGWIYPIDYWGGSARAESSDWVEVIAPNRAGETVEIVIGTLVQGGLDIAGAAAHADGRASVDVAGSSLRSFRYAGGSPAPTWIAQFHGGGPSGIAEGRGTLFSDSARMQFVRYDPDGDAVYEPVFDYSPRWDLWALEVALDPNGRASFWSKLRIDVSAGEDGSCKSSDERRCELERGAADANYLDTVVGYYRLPDPEIDLVSQAGWEVQVVPEPSTLALGLLGIAGGVALRRRVAGRRRSLGSPRRT